MIHPQSYRAELIESVSRKDQHLADCRERRATPYLTGLMEAWAGTSEIDFKYVASIIRYELEEDLQNIGRMQ